MTVVKMCGVRTLADAQAAASAGADVLGFNFYPGSKRYIAPARAQAIIAALRVGNETPPLACGLFVNAPAHEIRAVVAQCKLDAVQFSGDESPQTVAAVGMPTLKSLRAAPGETAPGLAERLMPYVAVAQSLPPGPFGQSLIPLLDASVPGEFGGTGQRADWLLAAHYLALGAKRLMLAGGLTPETVGSAVRVVRPWAVDVASGIEVAPGRKDAAKMRAFVRAVRAADAEVAPDV